MIEIIHWLTLIAGTFVAFIYFRDLGDVTQMVLNVKRSNILFAIRYENYMLATSITLIVAAAILHLEFGAGIGWLLKVTIAANVIMLGFPWI